jgi:hypothetical protein
VQLKASFLVRFTPSLLAGMALVAGLALLTRVSTGMGLYAATGLLLAALVIIDAVIRNESASRRGADRLLAAVLSFQGTDGKLLFEPEQTRLLDSVELPHSSFFLTDLLPIVFIVFLAASILHAQSLRPISLWRLLALAAGLALPCVLMLTAISMHYRYRMEWRPAVCYRLHRSRVHLGNVGLTVC